jgi:hypothetical protein
VVAFDVRVLLWFPRLNELELNTPAHRPLSHRFADVLGAAVRANHLRHAAPLDQLIQGAHDPRRGKRAIDFNHEALAIEIIEHVEQAKAPAVAIRGTPRALTRFRQVVGSLDFTLPANEEFRAYVTRLAIAQEYTLVPNVGHDTMALLEALGERNFALYRAVFAAR